MTMVERITVDEAHARMKAQGVSAREHVAMKCPMCGTVQSMASLIRAGADPATVERSIGFSCEGRWTNAGPWPSDRDRSAKAKTRRLIRGCDWTLGGLFKIHKLEVVMPDGKVHMSFAIASADEAQALEAATVTETAS